MVWLVIIVTLLLLVAPVMWLKPSPRQRRVVPLRNAAAGAGVKVGQERPPLHGMQSTMPSYRWTYSSDAPGPRFVLVRSSEASDMLKPYVVDWRWRIEPLRSLPEAARESLEALLMRLPQDALVVESSESAITLWWWESQTAERFLTYAEDFTRLRTALAGHADRRDPKRAFNAKGHEV